jgi:hypothetical protein
MAKKVKITFDAKVFLATVNGGRAKFTKDDVIFSQSESRFTPSLVAFHFRPVSHARHDQQAGRA